MNQTNPGMTDSEIFSSLKSAPPSGGVGSSGGTDWYSQVKAGAYTPQNLAPKPTPSFGERVQSDLANRGQEMLGTIDRAATGKQSDFSTGYQVGGQGAGLITDIAGEAFKSIPGHQLIEKALENTVPGGAIKNITSILGKYLGPSFQKVSQDHPEAAANFEATMNAANVAALAEGGKGLVENAPAIAEGTGKILSKGAEVLKSSGQNIAEGFGKLTGGVKTTIEGLPEEAILKTPENEVYKLSPPERKAWFDNQKSQITESSNLANEQSKTQLQKIDSGKAQMDTQILQQHKTNAEALTKEAEDLQRQVQTTARDKVVELRPKIIQAMGEQSKTYRGLVDEAMAGKENIPVDKQALKDFVDSRFGEDPGRAAAIKDRLGLTEQVDPMTTKKIGTEIRQQNTTLGEIFKQAKGLKQELSGAKVFTSADKLTDDAINTLSEYMKKGGIDLKEANQFWSKYAPIRDQLVSEAKPFLQTGTNTKTFANTLIRVAKGVDVNNENFINEVENMLGEPIQNETKMALEKLDVNQKQTLANEVDTEMKKTENIANTQRLKKPVVESQVEGKKVNSEKIKTLSSKELEIERQARTRGILKKILYTAGGIGVDKIIKKYTGIGF